MKSECPDCRHEQTLGECVKEHQCLKEEEFKKPNQALLENLMGITETKIAILDILIKLAKKQEGKILLEDLEQIKKEVIHYSKNAELNDVFSIMEEGDKY
jgi:thiol-disulfide isomerase/thioredoxin